MTTTAIKERPILFSGEMVRAILARRKTQTRRVVKYSQPSGRNGYWPSMVRGEPKLIVDGNRHRDRQLRCPYGKPGDRLWVRETWAPMQGCRPIPNPEIYDNKPAWYKADCDRPMWAGSRWHPSIHMPRRFSRITLEITGVRVERLRSISSADAVREGLEPTMRNETPAVTRFADLWRKINGPESWDANPWVWVIEFKRLTADHQ